MDGMKAMQQVVKGIARMFSGQGDCDAAAVGRASAEIVGLAWDAVTSKFPEGTTGHPSEANPEIRSDWGQFQALADQLALTARGLGRATGPGLDLGWGPDGHLALPARQGCGGGQLTGPAPVRRTKQ